MQKFEIEEEINKLIKESLKIKEKIRELKTLKGEPRTDREILENIERLLEALLKIINIK